MRQAGRHHCNGCSPSPCASTRSVHLAYVFRSTGTVEVFVNGLFNQTFANCSVVGAAPTITLNGRVGTTALDISATFAYVRGWRRALTQAEVLALALSPNSAYVNYTRPLPNTPYAFAYYNPGVGTATTTASFVVNAPSYALENIDIDPAGVASIATVATGSVASVTNARTGNVTSMLTMSTSLLPSATYATLWNTTALGLQFMPLSPVLQTRYSRGAWLSILPLQMMTRIITGTPATSVLTQRVWTSVRGSAGAASARVCQLANFSRPLDVTVDGSGAVAMPPLPLSALPGVYTADPGVAWTSVDGGTRLLRLCYNAALPASASAVAMTSFTIPSPAAWFVVGVEPGVRLLNDTLGTFTGVPLTGGASAAVIVQRQLVATTIDGGGVNGGAAHRWNFTFNGAAAGLSVDADVVCSNAASVSLAWQSDDNTTFVVEAVKADAQQSVVCGLSATPAVSAAGVPDNVAIADPANAVVPVQQPSASSTATPSGTATPSATSSVTASATGTGSGTGTGTGTSTGTGTGTPSATRTASGTGTGTASASVTPSATRTASGTGTGTATASMTPSPGGATTTSSPLSTVTGTGTATATTTGTGSPTAVASSSTIPSATSSRSPSLSLASSASPTSPVSPSPSQALPVASGSAQAMSASWSPPTSPTTTPTPTSGNVEGGSGGGLATGATDDGDRTSVSVRGGVGGGVAAAVFLLLLVSCFVYWRRRRGNDNAATPVPTASVTVLPSAAAVDIFPGLASERGAGGVGPGTTVVIAGANPMAGSGHHTAHRAGGGAAAGARSTWAPSSVVPGSGAV
jgi:hypothetical protein